MHGIKLVSNFGPLSGVLRDLATSSVSSEVIKMSDEVITKAEILSLVVRVAALSAISYYTVKWLMDAMDPTRKQKLRAQEKAKQGPNSIETMSMCKKI